MLDLVIMGYVGEESGRGEGVGGEGILLELKGRLITSGLETCKGDGKVRD